MDISETIRSLARIVGEDWEIDITEGLKVVFPEFTIGLQQPDMNEPQAIMAPPGTVALCPVVGLWQV